MAHLGADVAAYVDGQLSAPAMREASEHLESCTECTHSVRQQRLLKSRMSTVTSPEPPAGLLASLAGMAATPPVPERWWTRVTRSLPFRAGVVLASASVAVVVAAYAVGGATDPVGDVVSPPFNRYAADFDGPTGVQPASLITQRTITELDSSGWPCHATLAGDLRRTSATFTDNREVIALAYTNDDARLNLFEQTGRLDRSNLDGFELVKIGGAEVWVRDDDPMVVTWDEDGTVYTIVTDADPGRVEQAVSELPTAKAGGGPAQRISDGLSRMSAWANAA